MNFSFRLLLALSASLFIAGCGSGDEHGEDGAHTHADGTVHRDGDHADEKSDGGQDDHHVEPLASTMIGDMKVELGQGHGNVKAGKESHLTVKLPYSDKGSCIVRAWIGTADRTLSNPENGTYSASANSYDIHTVAPDPLPVDALWWIEIEKPDGTKAIGSAKPITVP